VRLDRDLSERCFLTRRSQRAPRAPAGCQPLGRFHRSSGARGEFSHELGYVSRFLGFQPFPALPPGSWRPRREVVCLAIRAGRMRRAGRPDSASAWPRGAAAGLG
jgi:hypothetical protein